MNRIMTTESFQRVRVIFLSFTLLTLAFTEVALAQQADNEYQVGAILWTQSSGEKAALAYQAFALARMTLDRDLRMNRYPRMKRALIVDLDETVIDNSRFQAMLVKTHQAYNGKLWTEWVNHAEATALPGAVEFLRYANSRGVRVLYITNRNDIEKEGTAASLKKLSFPNVNNETLLIRTDPNSSSKQPRRQSVSARYHVVLLMGDNLNDFAEVFENSKTVASRLSAVEQNKNQFGARFIVLPNPMYGDWENAIYDYNIKLTEAEKNAKRKSAIKDY